MSLIRATIREDLPALGQVLDSIDLFPATMLAEMAEPYFEQSAGTDRWYTLLREEQPVAFAYCVQELLTAGTHNLLAIGVLKTAQGQGLGQALMQHVEQELAAAGGRILIVDTSGASELALTRRFYEGLGYQLEATIRDFWQDGEDKVTYWKRL